MTGKDDRPERTVELRRQAEKIAREKAVRLPEDPEALSPAETRRMFHELRVHQVELEMQNEELRRVQTELETSRARYFDLYDLAPVGYATLSEQGLILEANLTAAALLGVARGALAKQPLSRFILLEDQNSYYEHRKKLFVTGEPQTQELRMVKKDNTVFWVRLVATVVQNTEGHPACRVVMSDIADRMQIEDSLRTANTNLEALWGIASLADGEIHAISRHILDSVVRITGSEFGFYGFVNSDESVMTIYSWSGEAMKNCRMADKPQAFPIATAGIWGEAIRRREPFIVNDYAAAHAAKRGLPEGHVALTNLLVVPHFTEGKIVSVAAIANRARDYDHTDVRRISTFMSSVQVIVDRKQTEDGLIKSEARFRSYFELPLHGIAITSPEKGWLQVNDRLCSMMGYSRDEIIKMTWSEMTYPDDIAAAVEQFNRVLAGHIDRYQMDKRFIRKDGTTIWTSLSLGCVRNPEGKVDFLVAVVDDITERKQAEAERLAMERHLLHAQKLESIGVLAGGIAHDFNNILAGILGHADLALRRLPASEPVRADIEVITKAARQASDLTRQMLAYSGKGKFFVEPLSLSQVVKDSRKMLTMSVSKKATVRYDLAADLPAIQADAGQISQIIMNLVINASEALGEQGGLIAVSTKAIPCQARDLAGMGLGQDLPEGVYVCLEVADTGCGMDEQTLSKIFDPFFTTKFTGRGLGLAAIHGIVRGHKGAIHVSSEPGKGTTFRVFFPASDPAPAVPSAPVATPGRCSGTILVVDDEELVRTLTKQMIQHFGFSALVASGGREAVELYREHQHEVDCVLLDLTMPDWDGAETFRELRRIRSDVPVILCSGYSEESATARFAGQGLSGFIQKPFQLDALIARIQEVVRPN